MYYAGMDIQQRIAARLKSLLKQRGMTQIDLAEKSGYSLQTLRSKFSCRVIFKLEDLEVFAEVLGVPLWSLMLDGKEAGPLAKHAGKLQKIASALDAQKDPHDLFVAIQTVIDIHRSRDAEKERQTENV